MTSVAIVVVAGAAGLGVLLIICGLAGRRVLGETARRSAADITDSPSSRIDRLGVRVLATVGVAGVVLLVSGWPVAAIAGGALGWWLPTAVRSGGRHQRELELVEAIATWAEQLRDTISAANGLEHAIGATAALAPTPLAGPVQRLAARVEYERLDDGLRRFADEVDHPLADFVVAALVTASQHQARELAGLLGHLSACARDEATMRSRVWVGRARTRSAVRIIVVVVVVFVMGLLAFDREYLEPYSTPSGQAVLALVLTIFGGSFVAMEKMGHVALPDRFVGRRAEAGR